MENTTINKRVCDFSKNIDIIQTIAIFSTSLLVPTFLGQILKGIFETDSIVVTNSQLIIGSIVNTALIIAALNLKGWGKILGVVTMPSIATILSGYVFKTASVYMVYMIPAIWLGNMALVFCYKKIMLEKNKNYFLAGVIGIILKVAIIFGGFEILNLFRIFPQKMVATVQTAMSITQTMTATIGMLIAFIIYKIETRKQKNS